MPMDDPIKADVEAAASGIMHCLYMLAQEAASLNLGSTAEALIQAAEICAQENRCSPIVLEPVHHDGADLPPFPRRIH